MKPTKKESLAKVAVGRGVAMVNAHSWLSTTLAVVALIALSSPRANAISPTNGVPNAVVEAFLTWPTDHSTRSPINTTNRLFASGDVGNHNWFITSSDGRLHWMHTTNMVPILSIDTTLPSLSGVLQLPGQTNLAICYNTNLVKGYIEPVQQTWTAVSTQSFNLFYEGRQQQFQGLSALGDKIFAFAARIEYEFANKGRLLSLNEDGSTNMVLNGVSNRYGVGQFSFFDGVYDCSMRMEAVNGKDFCFFPIDSNGFSYYSTNRYYGAGISGVQDPVTINSLCTGIVPFKGDDGNAYMAIVNSKSVKDYYQLKPFFYFTNSVNFVDSRAYPFLDYIKPQDPQPLPPFTLNGAMVTNGNFNVVWPPQYATAQLQSAIKADGQYLPLQVQPLPDNKGSVAVSLPLTNQECFRLAK